IVSRDARRRAPYDVDWRAERRLEARGVVANHQRDFQLVETLGRKRQADQPTAVPGHEIDGFWRYVVGGKCEIAFVLTVLLVDDHDEHASVTDRIDRLFDGRKRTLSSRTSFSDLQPSLHTIFALPRARPHARGLRPPPPAPRTSQPSRTPD